MLLVCTLSFSLFLPETGFTRTEVVKESLDNPTLLNKGETLNQTFDQTEDVHWYEVTPSNDEITANTHMRLTVSGEADLEVKIYSSEEKASKDDTFARYYAFNSGEQHAQLDFPYAWEGPYYIKVAYMGEMDPEESQEATDYQIGYETLNLPPSGYQEEETCPVILSTSQKKSAAEIITALHQVRDGLLKKSDKGKELTTLYYNAAPYLVADMIFDKKTKDDVYQNLVQLKPLFQDLAKNGENTSYRLTNEDQQAIKNLYDITIQSVPDTLENKINQIVSEKDLSQLAGKTLKSILNDRGLLDTDTNKLIIKMEKGIDIKTLSKKVSAQGFGKKSVSALTSSPELFNDIYVANLDNESHKALIDKLKKLPEVEFIEPVRKYHALSNDVQYLHQWSLSNTGQYGGKHGADIKHSPLQKLLKQRDLKETLIAVVDTGVDSSLSDLKGKVRTDLGKNFVARNNDANDDEGHGTHVTGIIAANMDNGYSMAGIHPNAKILPVKVLNEFGEGETDQVALGIIYAADQGAQVINLSLGGYYSRTIEYALQYAAAKNVTIVAASGNNGMGEVSYPASSKYAIAVGSTNRLDLVADYSDYGEELALVAPGSDIPSLLPDGNVTYLSGTSMATPHVTAVAGLLLSQNPKLKPKEIKKILLDTANNVAFEETDNRYMECYNSNYEIIPCNQQPGHDFVSGGGRLNAFSAVSAVDLQLKVNTLKDNKITVTGTAKKGSHIEVKKGNDVLGEAKADSNGKFTANIKKVQPAGSLLHVTGSDVKETGSDEEGTAKTSLKIIVEKGTPPSAPKVNAVSNKSTVVTGKTAAGLKVKIKNKSKKVIASGTANSKGDFKIKIKKQKAGTTLYVTTTDLAKRESKATKIVVKDKIPPKAPKVNAVTTNDTVIKGKTEAYATVTVTRKGKKIGSKKANSKGEFKVKIKKQKANSVLTISAKDKAGNKSKMTKVTVKKYKRK
nr:S8 family serine peptidase [Sporosarcina jiandibaonis]